MHLAAWGDLTNPTILADYHRIGLAGAAQLYSMPQFIDLQHGMKFVNDEAGEERIVAYTMFMGPATAPATAPATVPATAPAEEPASSITRPTGDSEAMKAPISVVAATTGEVGQGAGGGAGAAEAEAEPPKPDPPKPDYPPSYDPSFGALQRELLPPAMLAAYGYPTMEALNASYWLCYELAVDPEFQRRGLATRLLSWGVELAGAAEGEKGMERKAEGIYVVSQPEFIELYKKAGFNRDGNCGIPLGKGKGEHVFGFLLRKF